MGAGCGGGVWGGGTPCAAGERRKEEEGGRGGAMAAPATNKFMVRARARAWAGGRARECWCERGRA